jgi:hypothetical protein
MNVAPTPQDSQEPTLDELADTAVAIAYGEQGYIDASGEPYTDAIVDVMTDLIRPAVAHTKRDRAKVCISRREIMARVFPKVVGPEGWADEADPELAEEVYKRLDSVCWRLTTMSPDGQIQARLNSDDSLVLLRTTVNPHRTQAVYVTRDLGCLLEDAIKPQRAAEKKRADRDAAFTAMLIERVPEHGKRLNRELVGGLTTALTSAKAITAAALEAIDGAITDDSDGEAVPGDDGGEDE